MSENTRQIMIGFDLGKENCQITYTENGMEMVSVSTVLGNDVYQIPTRICKKKNAPSWHIGQEACRLHENGEGYLVEDLLTKAMNRQKIRLEGEEYDGVEILNIFLKKVMGIVFTYVKREEIVEIMFTVSKLNCQMIELWDRIKPNLGVDLDKLYIQDDTESLYWYQIQRKKLHKTLVIEYYEHDGYCRMLAINEKKEILDGRGEDLELPEVYTEDEYLLSLVQQAIGKQIVETIYLMGKAFENRWYPNTLKYLCKGRRVFLGQNLYTRGACFHAYMHHHPEQKRFVYHADYRLDFSVELEILRMQKPVCLELLSRGCCWFDAKKKIEVLNDGMSAITFTVRMENGKMREVEIPLSDMETRPEKSTRLSIFLQCISPNVCRIKITDEGLGNLIPSSGKVWQQDFTFEELRVH